MPSVRQAIIYSSLSRYILKLIGLILMMTVARLLTPSEIGTFAIASAVVIIMSEFRLLGAGGYLIREKELTKEKIKSALGLTILMSWSLGLMIFTCAPFVAQYYEIEPIKTIFRILSISFFFAPFLNIHSTLLSRKYQFSTIFFSKVAGSLVGLIGTISLILAGYSYYSLAWGQTMVVVTQLLVMQLLQFGKIHYTPSFLQIKQIAVFGVTVSVSGTLNKAVLVIPDLVIGKLGNTTEVGLFSRGLGLAEFLLQTMMMGISPIFLPYLSKINRKNTDDLHEAYARVNVLIGGMVWPVMAVAGISSLPAIRVFFGEQWDFAAPIASWLAIWAILRTFHANSNNLMIIAFQEKALVIKEFILFSVYLFSVILLYPYGLVAVAIGFLIGASTDIILSSVMLWYFQKFDNISYLNAQLKSFGVTILCALATYAISLLLDFKEINHFKVLLVISLMLPPIWLLSLRLFKHPMLDEILILLNGIKLKLANR